MTTFLGSTERLTTDLPVFAIGFSFALVVYATGVFDLPTTWLLACAVVSGYASTLVVRWINA